MDPTAHAALLHQGPLLAAAVGALMVGVTGSVHCLAMCGPLACASVPFAPGAQRRRAIASYQGARIASYALVGGLLGALGGGVASALSVSTRPYLPWIMAAALVASALDLGRRLSPLPGVSHLSRAIARAGARFSFPVRSGAMGAVTPLLPCGLLYGVLAAAVASGGFGAGALLTAAFAAGGLPALFGAQLQGALWRADKPIFAFAFRRVLPIAAAAVLVYRAIEVGEKAACH